MGKEAFISYDFSDATFKGEVESWLLGLGISVFSVNKKDLVLESRVVAKKRIKEQIAKSALLLILVGNDTHNRSFVNYEIAVAQSKKIPAFWIRLSNRRGAPPPEVRGLECIEYSKSDLLQLLIRLEIIKH